MEWTISMRDCGVVLRELADSVINMDEKMAAALSQEALEIGIEAYIAISNGLAKGMEQMGEKYEHGVCFIPELLLASDAMYAGMDILKPHLKIENKFSDNNQYVGIIGVIEGDIHDIGKNLVKIMFEASGFKMIDLGRDVPATRFINTAITEHAQIICLSSLMTTAIPNMSDVVVGLDRRGLRSQVKVMVGGASVSASFASRIGADGYAPNASAAVTVAKRLLDGNGLG